MKIVVELTGCDDYTRTIIDDVTPEQFAFLERVAVDVARASGSGCQPTLYVAPAEEDDPLDDE